MYGHDWSPTPEQLAAYFDGEMEGRDESAALKGQVEAWLDRHPEGRPDLEDVKHLQRIWRETTPAEPSAEAFDRVLAAVSRDAVAERGRVVVRSPATQSTMVSRSTGLALIALAGILIAIGFAFRDPPGPVPSPKPAEEEEIFLVATEDEITIVRVEGADMSTLVVGLFPVQGILELLAPGDVDFMNIRPDPRDQMMPNIPRDPGSAPIIWARTENEEDKP